MFIALHDEMSKLEGAARPENPRIRVGHVAMIDAQGMYVRPEIRG